MSANSKILNRQKKNSPEKAIVKAGIFLFLFCHGVFWGVALVGWFSGEGVVCFGFHLAFDLFFTV